MGKHGSFKPNLYEKKEPVKVNLLEVQRRSFDENAKKSYHWVNTSYLDITRLKPLPKGMITSIMVMFDNPIPRELVREKLDLVFG